MALTTPEEMKSVLLHELQHSIQDIEGFAKGGNVDMFERAISDQTRIREAINKMDENFGYSKWLDDNNVYEKYKAKYGDKIADHFDEMSYEFAKTLPPSQQMAYISALKDFATVNKVLEGSRWDETPYNIYMRTAGEQEARAVQAALKHPELTPYEALLKEEGKIDKPIVKFEDGVMEMSPVKSKSQKEKRGIYNVTYGDKKSTVIYKDLDFVDEVIKYEKGKHNKKTNKGFGSVHIEEHIGKDKNGWVTSSELLNIGKAMRSTVPYINDGKRVYEYYNTDGVRFRVIIGDKKGGERTISFFSNRKIGIGNDSQNYIYDQPSSKRSITQKQNDVKKVY